MIANYNTNIRIMTSYTHLKIIVSIEADLKDVFVTCIIHDFSKEKQNDIAHEMQIEHPFYLDQIKSTNIKMMQ